MSPARTAEPIELPFGLRTWVGPGNHVLDVDPDPPWEEAKFCGSMGRDAVWVVGSEMCIRDRLSMLPRVHGHKFQ